MRILILFHFYNESLVHNLWYQLINFIGVKGRFRISLLLFRGHHKKDQNEAKREGNKKLCLMRKPLKVKWTLSTYPTSFVPSSSSSSFSGAALTFHWRFFGFFDSRFTDSPATCFWWPRLGVVKCNAKHQSEGEGEKKTWNLNINWNCCFALRHGAISICKSFVKCFLFWFYLLCEISSVFL